MSNSYEQQLEERIEHLEKVLDESVAKNGRVFALTGHFGVDRWQPDDMRYCDPRLVQGGRNQRVKIFGIYHSVEESEKYVSAAYRYSKYYLCHSIPKTPIKSKSKMTKVVKEEEFTKGFPEKYYMWNSKKTNMNEFAYITLSIIPIDFGVFLQGYKNET